MDFTNLPPLSSMAPSATRRVKAVVCLIFCSATAAFGAERSFHPIGIYLDLQRVDYRREPIERWTRVLQGLRGLGFNTVVAKTNEAMLERAELLDFKVITGANPGNPERTRQWEQYDSLLAWLGIDEPGRSGRIPEAKQQYLAMREIAQRPIAVSLYLPSAYPEANDLADILLPDPYIFGHVRRDGSMYGIDEIANRIGALKGQLHQGKKLWAVPQLYAWYPFFKRPPTATELEAETILCLGEGAEGIIYFALNSGQYFPNPPDFEPAVADETPEPWELYDHPALLGEVRRINKITRHVLQQFDPGAEKKSLPDGGIRYTWRRGEDSFAAEVHLKPEVHVDYNFQAPSGDDY